MTDTIGQQVRYQLVRRQTDHHQVIQTEHLLRTVADNQLTWV